VVIPWLYSGMKTAISLPDELFADADRFAAKIGISRSQLYATALAEYLARHRDGDVTAALDRVYGTPSLSDDELGAAARDSLRRAEWS
jgi:metal-responsive CopG/Arc/MetJ family transcriptional regulator